MNHLNIVSNFVINQTDNMELAVMPNELAKTLLREYAAKLQRTTREEIVNNHCNELQRCSTLKEAVDLSINWTQERLLIENVSKGNWDVFKVDSFGE